MSLSKHLQLWWPKLSVNHQLHRWLPSLANSQVKKFSGLAIGVGLIAAYLSLNDIFNVNFTPPCYLRYIFPSNTSVMEEMQVNCCGRYRNLNRFANGTDLCRLREIWGSEMQKLLYRPSYQATDQQRIPLS